MQKYERTEIEGLTLKERSRIHGYSYNKTNSTMNRWKTREKKGRNAKNLGTQTWQEYLLHIHTQIPMKMKISDVPWTKNVGIVQQPPTIIGWEQKTEKQLKEINAIRGSQKRDINKRKITR